LDEELVQGMLDSDVAVEEIAFGEIVFAIENDLIKVVGIVKKVVQAVNVLVAKTAA